MVVRIQGDTREEGARFVDKTDAPSALVTYRSTVVIAAQSHSIVRRSIETARQSSQHSCRCAAALMRVAWHWGQLRI